MSNAIAIENEKQGNPESEWGLLNGASSDIEGFATDSSYGLGETASFKINTDASNYRIDIYRLGYYNGDGARLVNSIQHQSASAINQPSPLVDPSTGVVDAGNWSVTDTWDIPADLVSGVYIAKLVREDGIVGENHIPFVVRNDHGNSDIVLKTADETWQAYNPWGGNSLYEGGDVAVSYNRPIITAYDNPYAETRPWNYIFGEEYPAIRWLERNGLDVSYVAGADLARNGDSLLTHKVFLSVGHDEYWSAEQRSAVEAARDSGVNLMFWSGNEVYWKTRWADSIDGSGDGYRTLISYKETNQDAKVDPSNEWTGLWRDLRFTNGTESIVPENALTGTFYWVDYDRKTPVHSLVVTSDYADMPIWRNTAVSALQPGQSISYPELIGYEWDVVASNGFNPATLITMSSTSIQSDAVLQDQYAKVLSLDTATHSITLYKAESGALVFGAGTVMWAWALDDEHALGPNGTGGNGTAQADIQQAMINLFADMGVLPETLQSNLVEGGSFGDDTAPTVDAYTTETAFQIMAGDSIWLSGTAADADGHLAGVLVSGDNGATWQRADGAMSWTGAAHVRGQGAQTILVKSFDTSFNMSEPWSTEVTVSYGMTAALTDLAVEQGWTSANYKRLFADLDGDGVKDLVGFGEEATLGYLGATGDVPGFRTLGGETNVVLEDFGGNQGYSVDALRGVDYLGEFAGEGSRAAVIWGQTADGIRYHKPTSVGPDIVVYDPVGNTTPAFGTASGWTSAHSIDVGFVASASSQAPDAYGSAFGFGNEGLFLARQAFAPNSTASAVLVAGSEEFGNNSGWSNGTDIRAVRDHDGQIIDLNHDGVVDVVALGQQGTVYALGRLTENGTGASDYSLGQTVVAQNSADGLSSEFGTQQGWTENTTLRALIDINNDNYVDIIGFGDAGITVSEGRATAADGSGAFAQSYLALADYGTASGWGASDHIREFGDFNGDGIVDIIGFGDDSTLVAHGSIDASGKIGWTLTGILGDFGIAEGWSSTIHMRSVVDLNGDGKVELFASGDANTRIIANV